MKWVSVYDKQLHVRERGPSSIAWHNPGFFGVVGTFAVHEFLFDPLGGELPPLFPALVAAQAGGAPNGRPRSLIWVDPASTFYPPGVLGRSVFPGQLDVVRPSPQDLTWAVMECLRCRHVGAVVALLMNRLTPVEVRRLQLAAEQGGAVGVLLRPNLPGAEIYAAATRWRVSPAPGDRAIQRWRVQQIHGHGRWTSFFLEKHRATGQTHFVHPSAPLVDQPVVSATS